jgi:hypothetical protein
MRRWLKALPLTLALAALIVFATFAASCGSNNSQARFVNAISDNTTTLDIYFNGTKAFGLTNTFPTDSGSTYVSIPTGSDKIQGFSSGTNTNPVFTVPNSPISFKSGSQYTVVAMGRLASTVTVVAPVESSTAPANGSVNFNVIDASPAYTQAVDVYILQDQTSTPGSTCFGNDGCTPTISALASPASSITPYTTTPATVPYNSLGFGYTLYVAEAGSSPPTPLPGWTGYPFSVGSVTVGSIRTIVLVDNPGGSNGMSAVPIILSDLN